MQSANKYIELVALNKNGITIDQKVTDCKASYPKNMDRKWQTSILDDRVSSYRLNNMRMLKRNEIKMEQMALPLSALESIYASCNT